MPQKVAMCFVRVCYQSSVLSHKKRSDQSCSLANGPELPLNIRAETLCPFSDFHRTTVTAKPQFSIQLWLCSQRISHIYYDCFAFM